MLTEFQKKKLTHLFHVLDVNGDQGIDTKDLDLVVERTGAASASKSPERLAQLRSGYHAWYTGMIEMADLNRDGKVTLDEFLTFNDKMVNDDALFQQIIGGIAQMTCQIMDSDSDGRNDTDDYVSFCQVMRIDDKEAPARWAAVDANQDGFLDVNDVLVVLKDFFTGEDPNSPATSYFGRL